MDDCPKDTSTEEEQAIENDPYDHLTNHNLLHLWGVG